MHRLARLALVAAALLVLLVPARAEQWAASWTGAAQGPYPVGYAIAQPDLRFAFSDPARGAQNQSFRMIVRPDVWGREVRVHLSNAFGTRSVTFDAVSVGLQESGSAVVARTSTPALFGGKSRITVEPGATAVSDPAALRFVSSTPDPLLKGRKLAVSFHVVGESGPMTWHAAALTASYVGLPGTEPKIEADEAAFPFSTASWFFLSEVDMRVGDDTKVIVALGDSITDGVTTTINGDDRWTDVLSRRLHARVGERFAVVNQGIVGNRIIGPPDYAPARSAPGGPGALARLERDVIALPNVAAVIWLEGINDFGDAGATVENVTDAFAKGVARLREGIPGVRIVAGTLPPALRSTIGTHGSASVDAKRKALNAFIRSSRLFDAVIDFEAATLDPRTGELKAEMQPGSSTGGPGDKLHPNRAGYAAMANAIDLDTLVGAPK